MKEATLSGSFWYITNIETYRNLDFSSSMVKNMIGSYPPGRKWMASKWKAEVDGYTPGNWKSCGNRWMWMWFFSSFKPSFSSGRKMFYENFMKQMHTIHIGISSMNIFWVGWRKWLNRTWLNHIGHLFFRSHVHLRNNFCCTVVAQVENSSIWIEVEWSDVRCWLSIYTSKSVWFQFVLSAALLEI